MSKDPCPICDRPLGTLNVDQHHLIPKCRKGKEKSPIHRVCHRKIHATFTEKQLEKVYNTWEMLRSHEEIQKFIDWVKNKPSDFYSGTDTANAKRR